MNITEFVKKHKITISSRNVDSNPNMFDCYAMNNFKVTLFMARKQMTLYYSQGYGIHGNPKADDVLNCIASDSSSVENNHSLEDWCAEFGYEDHQTALKTYKACQKQAERAKQFLGDELYEQLLWNTEPL